MLGLLKRFPRQQTFAVLVDLKHVAARLGLVPAKHRLTPIAQFLRIGFLFLLRLGRSNRCGTLSHAGIIAMPGPCASTKNSGD